MMDATEISEAAKDMTVEGFVDFIYSTNEYVSIDNMGGWMGTPVGAYILHTFPNIERQSPAAEELLPMFLETLEEEALVIYESINHAVCETNFNLMQVCEMQTAIDERGTAP